VKKKVFNWSELHFSEVSSYKIHTLGELAFAYKCDGTLVYLSKKKLNNMQIMFIIFYRINIQ